MIYTIAGFIISLAILILLVRAKEGPDPRDGMIDSAFFSLLLFLGIVAWPLYLAVLLVWAVGRWIGEE